MAIITAGWTYRFKFKLDFASLDGTYTIGKIYSWLELLNDRISLYDVLYQPLGISSTKFNKDILTYKDKAVYKLVSPENGTIIFAPEDIFDSLPIYTVKEYQNLVVYLPLGVYEDAEKLQYIVDYLKDNLQAGLGVLQYPRIVATGSTYLTEKEYDVMVATRNIDITKILSTASALNRANSEIVDLKNKIANYEKILKELIGSNT